MFSPFCLAAGKARPQPTRLPAPAADALPQPLPATPPVVARASNDAQWRALAEMAEQR